MSGREGGRDVIPTCVPVDVEHLTGKEQAVRFLRHHRLRGDLLDGDPATRDERLIEIERPVGVQLERLQSGREIDDRLLLQLAGILFPEAELSEVKVEHPFRDEPFPDVLDGPLRLILHLVP